MVSPVASFRHLAVLLVCVASIRNSLEAQSSFSWQLSETGLTSAGIFDLRGSLVRTLWAMERFEAGTFSGSWDGLDDFGAPVATASYTWKVLRNGAQYANIGVIGNTGLPPITSGHVPYLIEGVAVDAQANIYTVHDWNEPHFDVIRWSSVDGKSQMNTGQVISEALLKAIAVEPDGSYAYVTGYGGNLTKRSESKFSIWRISLAPGLGAGERVVNFTQQGRCIKVYDGNNGGYPSAGYPTPEYPANATEADKDVMRVPLISIAVQGSNLYVTDAIGGRILRYNKVSGNFQSVIQGVPVACGLAIASNGNIWVGHEHTKVSVYSPAGVRLATPIADLTEVRALSIQGDTLAVADRVGQIRKYTIKNNNQLTKRTNYGQPQRPGDRRPERLSAINGMAMDTAGNVIFSDRLGDGSRLQKINAQRIPVWQQMCLEFSPSAAYGQANPDLLISSYRKAYSINRSTGTWNLLGTAKTEAQKRYFGNYESTHLGPPRVVRLGANDFFYYPAGDSLAVYRVVPPAGAERGPTLRLASVLGGSQPSPDGIHRDETYLPANRYLWEWNDTQGDGEIQYLPKSSPGLAGEVTLVGVPGLPDPYWQWFRRAFEVDDAGWVWFASANRDHIPNANYPFEGEALYAMTPKELNNRGNPVYSWSRAVKVSDADTGRSALSLSGGERFEWKMVGRSSDGMVYALAWSNKAGLPQDGALWMGGNVLFGFLQPNPTESPASLGAPRWRVPLPNQCVGMVPISGGPGGVLVGIDANGATVGHYTKEGLLIGSMETTPPFRDPAREPWVVGRLDSYLAINCSRDPRDGLIDVFVEDNINQRIVWHRVRDTNIQTADEGVLQTSGTSGTANSLTVMNGTGDGKYSPGTTVNLAATAPPTNKVFARWTGNTTGVADVSSPNTTLVMPANPVTVTAVYTWASGEDTIRFFPDPGQRHRLLDSVWEGTNGDKDTGPYEVFYRPEEMPGEGWNQRRVNTKGFRYLRWRQLSGNGVIYELEWYRNNGKEPLSGPFFGTSGSWNNNPNWTWEKAVDGDTSTGFNGPDVNTPGWINPYIGVDSRVEARTLTVENGSGTGLYDPGTTVLVNAGAAPSGQEFASWTGDTAILANPLASRTSATMPSIDVKIAPAFAGDTAGTGLRGEYYNDGNAVPYPLENPFTGTPALIRTDGTVDFDWGENSPDSAVSVDHFSVTWTGWVKAPVSGHYTFRVTADDGVRLLFDGIKVVDGWKNQDPTTYVYTATLQAGTLYNIEVQFYEYAGRALCRLHWSYPGQVDQAIPQGQLFPPAN